MLKIILMLALNSEDRSVFSFVCGAIVEQISKPNLDLALGILDVLIISILKNSFKLFESH